PYRGRAPLPAGIAGLGPFAGFYWKFRLRASILAARGCEFLWGSHFGQREAPTRNYQPTGKVRDTEFSILPSAGVSGPAKENRFGAIDENLQSRTWTGRIRRFHDHCRHGEQGRHFAAVHGGKRGLDVEPAHGRAFARDRGTGRADR